MGAFEMDSGEGCVQNSQDTIHNKSTVRLLGRSATGNGYEVPIRGRMHRVSDLGEGTGGCQSGMLSLFPNNDKTDPTLCRFMVLYRSRR